MNIEEQPGVQGMVQLGRNAIDRVIELETRLELAVSVVRALVNEPQPLGIDRLSYQAALKLIDNYE